MHHYFEKFEAYREARPFTGNPIELYEPVNYIMELGGKRMRPVLALMGYHLFREDYSPALPLAYALEIFHNFSLVHDDIMDAAPLRRNQQTVHMKWNTNLAILAGDVMLIKAYDYLLQLPEKEHVVPIISAFNRVAREVCEGQQMDMNFELRKDVSIAEYIRMIELKTSVLVGGALEMAGLAFVPIWPQHRHRFPNSRRLARCFWRNRRGGQTNRWRYFAKQKNLAHPACTGTVGGSGSPTTSVPDEQYQ
jgi:geranylgeranyl diphosphate synthase, type II